MYGLGQITSYNAGDGYSSLVNCVCQTGRVPASSLRPASVYATEPVSKTESNSDMTSSQQRDLARFSEKLLAEMYRQKHDSNPSVSA